MADRSKALLRVGLLALAGGAAWLATSGLDPGLDALPPPPVASAPPASPAPGPAVDAVPAPPSVAPSPAVLPAPDADAAPTGPVASSRPAGPLSAPPPPTDVAERVRDATADATTRRIDLMERLFATAAEGATSAEDQARVQVVLDDAVAQMRGVERQVRDGALGYRDAVERMDALREAAGDQIEAMLPEAEATPVKLRMGIRPLPDPAREWDGVPFDQAGR